MKRIVVLFLGFYCMASFAVLNIPNDEPGTLATVTAESAKVNHDADTATAPRCSLGQACLFVSGFAGTDTFGETTWVSLVDYKLVVMESCSPDMIESTLKRSSYIGEVRSSALSNKIPPSKGSYRIYGSCNTPWNSGSYWSTLDQPWDGIPLPVCGLNGPDVIDFGELKPAAVSGKSKKARYTISCDKKATVKVTFAFASGESSAKIADDLTLALKVGTQDGVKGQTYTVNKSAVQSDLTVDLKSGGSAPVGDHQASAVVKLTVE